jgi:hypothetical protein
MYLYYPIAQTCGLPPAAKRTIPHYPAPCSCCSITRSREKASHGITFLSVYNCLNMATISAGPDIPLVDFTPFLYGSICYREQVAASIDAGLNSTGFIYLINHGINQNRVDECFNWVSRYFYTCVTFILEEESKDRS